MAQTVKALVVKHAPAVKAHVRENLHWHTLGVVVVVLFKEYALAIVIDVVRHGL